MQPLCQQPPLPPPKKKEEEREQVMSDDLLLPAASFGGAGHGTTTAAGCKEMGGARVVEPNVGLLCQSGGFGWCGGDGEPAHLLTKAVCLEDARLRRTVEPLWLKHLLVEAPEPLEHGPLVAPDLDVRQRDGDDAHDQEDHHAERWQERLDLLARLGCPLDPQLLVNVMLLEFLGHPCVELAQALARSAQAVFVEEDNEPSGGASWDANNACWARVLCFLDAAWLFAAAAFIAHEVDLALG